MKQGSKPQAVNALRPGKPTPWHSAAKPLSKGYLKTHRRFQVAFLLGAFLLRV